MQDEEWPKCNPSSYPIYLLMCQSKIILIPPINTQSTCIHSPFATYTTNQLTNRNDDMGKYSICLALLLLSTCTISIAVSERQSRRRGSQQQEWGNECQFDRINALEPDNEIRAEAGLTEVWNSNEDQFQCAGVAVVRRTIEQRGLLLPSFTSAPELVYIVQGRGIQGLLMPGCPETYQSFQESSQSRRGEEEESPRRHGGGQSRRFQDTHQKIRRFRQGDIIAIPAGVAHWTYNDGDEPVVAIVLVDTKNKANQLNHNAPTRFYLAGNTQPEHEEQCGRQQQQQQERGERRGESQQQNGNILSGFDLEFLAEAFGVSEETARRLQGQEDERGNIVRVEEGLHVIRPPTRRSSEEEEEGTEIRRRSSRREGRGEEEEGTEIRRRSSRRGGRGDDEAEEDVSNGLDEVMCRARLTQNIDDPSKADVFTPQAGRLSTLNSFDLPILNYLKLSATKGLLYRNAIMAPHYNLNANSIIYAVRGSCRIQIVNNQGQAIFDDELQERQVVVVPQGFAVIKQASEEGFDWIEFQTNENAMIQNLAGRTSVIRSLPEQVIANMYGLEREEARRLKFNRQETTLFPSSERSMRTREGRTRERRADA